MNIEDVRQQLAEGIKEITPDAWQVTTETDPDVYTGLIQIGHATDIRLDSMDGIGFELPITAWIDETSDVLNVRDLYTLLSAADGSILKFFNESTLPDVNVGEALVEPRFKGQSQYLVAELSVRLGYLADES